MYLWHIKSIVSRITKANPDLFSISKGEESATQSSVSVQIKRFLNLYEANGLNDPPFKVEEFVIAAYPGNCSSVVVSNTDSLWHQFGSDCIEQVLRITTYICKQINYSFIHLTTTDEKFMKFLQVNKGFKCIFSGINVRTGYKNYFLVLEVL